MELSSFLRNGWVWAIAVLWIVGAIDLARFALFLLKERRGIAETWDRLPKDDAKWTGNPLPTLKAALPGRSVLALIMDKLERARRLESSLDPQLISDMVSVHMRRRLGIPNWVAGVLILIGLMGTLVGLGGTVASLADAAGKVEVNLRATSAPNTTNAPEAAVQQILSAWKAAMGSTTTAFHASLAGVAATVTFLFGLMFVRRFAEDTSRQINELVSVELLPVLAGPDLGPGLANIGKQIESYSKLLQDLTQTMGLQVARSQQDAGDAIIMTRQADKRNNELLAQISKVFEKQDAMTGKVGELSEVFGRVNQKSSEMLTTAGEVLTRSQALGESAARQFDAVIERLEKLFKELPKLLGKEDTSSWTARIAHLDEVASNQASIVSRVADHLLQMKSDQQDALVSIRAISDSITEQFSRTEVRDIQAIANRLVEELPLHDMWSALARGAQQMPEVATNIDDSAKVIRDMLAELKQAVQSIEALAVMQSSQRTRFDELAESITQKLDRLVPRLGEVPNSTGGQPDGFQAELGGIRNAIERQSSISLDILSSQQRLQDFLIRSHVFKSHFERLRKLFSNRSNR